MKTANTIRCCVAALLLTACGSQPAQGTPVPALLENTDDNSHAELERAVSEALHGVTVTLADDALTEESLLIIERRPVRNLQHPGGLNGRKLEKPEKFRLMTDGSGCWLVKLSDNSRWSLPGASCVPEQSAED